MLPHGIRLLCAALLLLTPATALSAAAARVEFVSGKVIAVDARGNSRTLIRGAEIVQGDTVDTGPGRVQLRFSDGAYVSLQPQSKFRVDEYRFEGKADGSERGFFSLLQGGLRTITGLVGRTNKRNYQVSTAVATIGIRGTEYTVSYGNSVSGSVGEGEIVVCNGAGCLDVTSGQSYYVAEANVLPVITGKKTDLPPPQPESPPAQLVAGDQTGATGTPAGLQFTGSQQLTLGVVVNVTCISACTPAFSLLPSDIITFNADGSVASVNSGKDPLTNVRSFGNDGFIAWGVGDDKFGQPFHYVTGLPAMFSELATLAAHQPVAYFDLIGGSTPTAVNPNTGAAVTGMLTGGVLEAQFAAGTANLVLDIAIAGTKLTVQAQNMTFLDNGGVLAFARPSVACSVGGCSGTVKGFIGSQGLRAGAIYEVSVSSVSLPGQVVGSAAFANRSPPSTTP